MAFAWSYSRLKMYEECPASYNYRHVLKAPYDDTNNEAFLKGRRVHGGLAAFLTGVPWFSDQDKKTYTEDMRFEAKSVAKFDAMLAQIKSAQPIVEQQWGFDANYRPSGWFGANVYYRNILDVGVLWPDNTFSVVDWKSGRPYGDNAEQMEQFAVAVFSRYPQVHSLETRLAYVDTGQEQHEEFLRSGAAALKDKWEKRVGVLKNDKTFVPRPGGQCRRCPFAKGKGGPCSFGG